MWNWEVVIDKIHENCRSWQTLKFEPRPVVFIRIVGTHNTANEVQFSFYCTQFLKMIDIISCMGKAAIECIDVKFLLHNFTVGHIHSVTVVHW